ncbi:MAG: hypothetical protein ACOH2T_19005 [Pseudomonas sp.]
MSRLHEMRIDELGEKLEKIRTAVAEYMYSEGCGCCRGSDHEGNTEVLAELLDMDKYSDGSGYDYFKYRANKSP